MSTPFVSILLVNYNGADIIAPTLRAVAQLTYPKDRYETIVVDNASTDTSIQRIQKEFPWVKIIQSSHNLGFAGGNNLAAKNAKGTLLAFLNTDAVPEPEWLSYLVKRLLATPKCAAVNGKTLLAFPSVPLTIQSDWHLKSEFTNSTDFSAVGVMVEQLYVQDSKLQSSVVLHSGFHRRDPESPYRWTNGNATILVPLDPQKPQASCVLTLRSEKSLSGIQTRVQASVGSHVLFTDTLSSYQVKQYELTLDTLQLAPSYLWHVQNAGSVVFRDGFGRDRGAVVENHTNRFELDSNLFSAPKAVTAFCGVAALVRADLFRKEHGFNEQLFMYYEDTELSLRWQRSGYNIWYEPKAVVKHAHAASSGEGSTFFLYQVEKNHLAFLLLHFPLHYFAKRLARCALSTVWLRLRALRWRAVNRWDLADPISDKASVRHNVLRWIIRSIPILFRTRWSMNRRLMPLSHIQGKFL